MTPAVLCAILAGVANGVLLGLVARSVDTLLNSHGANFAWVTVPLTLGLAGLIRGLALIGQSTLINRIGNAVVADVQRDLVANFMRGDLARLRATHTGEFVSKILFDAGLVREAATSGVMNYIQNGLTIVGVVAVLLWNDWALTIIVLVITPIVGWVLRDYSKRTTKAAHGAMHESSALASAVLESLDGVRVVKMENKEAFEEARVAAVIARRQKHIIAGADARAMAAPVSELMVTLMLALVVGYAGWRFQLGSTHLGPFPVPPVTPGTFTGFIAALMMGSQSLRQVANLQTVMSEGMIAARRLFATLDVTPTIRDFGAHELPTGDALVRLEDVTFAYGDEPAVLERLSLEARRGEIVALVGPSGAGKSTVLNLIPRFYEVTSGRVTLDGSDVRDVTLASLRHQIRARHPGAVPVRRHHTGQHRLRQGRRHRRRDRGGRAAGSGARLHSRPAHGLRDLGRRGGPAALRRPAPAHRHRPRVSEERAHPAARRGHQRPRHRKRGPGAGGARTADGGAHHHLDRAPPLDGARRRPHLCDRPRPGGRGRQSRAAGQPRRPLCAARRRPEPRPDAGGGGVKKLIRTPWVQSALAWLVSVMIGFTLATIRWRIEGREDAEVIIASPDGAIACFWHGRIALAPICGRVLRKKPRRVVISASPDGEFIAKVVKRLKFPAIRGSGFRADAVQDQRSYDAARDASRFIHSGGVLAITPDGAGGAGRTGARGAGDALEDRQGRRCSSSGSRRGRR